MSALRCRKVAIRHQCDDLDRELADVLLKIDRVLTEDDGVLAKSGWLISTHRTVKVYVRTTSHLVTMAGGLVDLATTFDFASIDLIPECQSRGYFRRLLRYVNANCYSRSGVYVENVMNERFLKYFTDRPGSWVPVPGVKLCFYQKFP